jgi:hypothetical protein
MPQGKSSFWWKNILKLCEAYRGVAMCKIGDGSSVLFWTDVWNDQRLCQKFPRLFSYANNKNVSVAQFLMHNQIEAQFHIPLSVQAFQEYNELQQIIQHLQVLEQERDK